MPTTTETQQPQSAETVASLQSENTKLRAERDEYKRMYLDTLALARRLELGLVRGRERDLGTSTPLSLLALMGAVPAKAKPVEEAPKTKVPEHERKKPTGRKPLPANLPRVTVTVVPPEVEREGLDAFEKIGEDVVETVERVPAKAIVVREVRPSFVRKQRATPDSVTVLQAEPLPKPIPGSLAGPGFLAETIVKRWADHTPLHRMERIFGRDGLELARSTIGGWHGALSDLLQPLINAMWADALASPYLCIDATGVLVQDNDKCRNAHFFVVAAPEKHVLFAYTPKHNNAAVDALVAEYVGVLVADAHTVYDHLFVSGAIREAGCWAHVRRYFYKSLGTEPARAREAIKFIHDLFEKERALKNVSVEQRKVARGLTHAPIVDAFEAWCDRVALTVVDESPLARAVQYAKHQRTALRTFLDDGRVPLDNNWSERELRRIAWGRDNWLFVGSDDGGVTAATFISLIASCQQHGLEPYAYLRDLLCVFPDWPADRYLELAPALWPTTSARADVQAMLDADVFRQVALGRREADKKP